MSESEKRNAKQSKKASNGHFTISKPEIEPSHNKSKPEAHLGFAGPVCAESGARSHELFALTRCDEQSLKLKAH